ncbi:MAG TPA: excinuclease ABC subunit UvrB [Planctomycetota bacterium]|nr:excinuclease ABC subunit UvrB [Planctomycetota bacterium]
MPALQTQAIKPQAEFKLHSDWKPAGDQPKAIEGLVEFLRSGADAQTLLGVTGSGKTFTIANVIQQIQKPTLIMAHNKTLATQLFQELREFFPENAVEYFVSYYDYYQPEAYVPSTDVYIEKDATMNERLDRLRHRATRSLLTRRDVVIVASVSCIYGLGSPEAYLGLRVSIKKGQTVERDELLRALAQIQYKRNDIDFKRGTFRARGDVLDVIPAHEDARALRVELFGDEVDRITEIDPLTGEVLGELDQADVYPKSHYVTPKDLLERALVTIDEELVERLRELRNARKLVEAQRLEQRTRYDLELLKEVGACAGIENYSRHLRAGIAGEPPPTLLDYFPDDSLIILDESHQTVPQLNGMYRGDRSRKEVLVNYGFRLPSALDNRPLRFDEFESYKRPIVFVSATPSAYERTRSQERIVQQVVRPTGLMDPEIEVRPTKDQVHDLKAEVEARAAKGERTLVTTLTKRMAEDLCEYYLDAGIKCKYMHSDIDTIERADIIKALREGQFDCLVGINLLREGLDIPEVSLVGVLDADKEGFLRNETALIQTCGRAARNVNGRVIFYADTITKSIQAALDETKRRRAIQAEYNKKHKITPKTIEKRLQDALSDIYAKDYVDLDEVQKKERASKALEGALEDQITKLRQEMLDAAARLDFERAAELRDTIRDLENRALGL